MRGQDAVLNHSGSTGSKTWPQRKPLSFQLQHLDSLPPDSRSHDLGSSSSCT